VKEAVGHEVQLEILEAKKVKYYALYVYIIV
jgi:hypothetical protein